MEKLWAIYDTTGKIFGRVLEGDKPQGLPAISVTIPDGYILLDYLDMSVPQNPKPVVMPTSILMMLENQIDTLQKQVFPVINAESCTLEELQNWQINQCKLDLAVYLQKNPLVSDCHNGKFGTYNITEDKLSIFTSKYLAHMVKTSQNIDSVMKWNETGKECEEWTDEECLALIIQWDEVSTPLVSYQQSIESMIANATSKEDILIIAWDYSSADPRR